MGEGKAASEVSILARLMHAQYGGRPTLPEAHEWEEITLPCAYHLRLFPDPVLMHPGGHPGLRCRHCGVVKDLTIETTDPRKMIDGWGYDHYDDQENNDK